jgi:hypothetical protein
VYWKFGRYRFPVAPQLGFWTERGDSNLGFETDTITKYQYSKNLAFTVYYGHLFAADGEWDGSFMHGNGFGFHGGTASHDADYAFLMTSIKF